MRRQSTIAWSNGDISLLQAMASIGKRPCLMLCSGPDTGLQVSEQTVALRGQHSSNGAADVTEVKSGL